MSNKARTLFFDIETSPFDILTWKVWETDAVKVLKDVRIISFSYRWGDSEKIYNVSAKGKDYYNDLPVVKKLWEVMSEADIIVAHNGDDFDVKHARARFAAHGLPPLAKKNYIDTKKIAKKLFNFPYNSLNEIARYLGCPFLKIDNGGIGTWISFMNGDKKAIKRMALYNNRDVKVLHWIYERMLGWMPNHPNVNLFSGKNAACPSCSSVELEKRGFNYRKIKGGVKKIQRFQCFGCGSWSTEENIIIKKLK